MRFLEFLTEGYGYMGNEGDTVAIRPAGKGLGRATTFRLINRKPPHNMVNMSFDDAEDAKAYAKERGLKVDNSSLDV